MRFDDLLLRYFGTRELETISGEALAGAAERMRVDLGLETDRSRSDGGSALVKIVIGGRFVQTLQNGPDGGRARQSLR